jgi:hypothetical protein
MRECADRPGAGKRIGLRLRGTCSKANIYSKLRLTACANVRYPPSEPDLDRWLSPLLSMLKFALKKYEIWNRVR